MGYKSKTTKWVKLKTAKLNSGQYDDKKARK